MSVRFQRAPKEKQKTTVSQWIVIGVIIVLFIVAWIIIWIVLVNNLFGGSGGAVQPGPTPGCTPSPGPTGLTASQPNIIIPSVLLEWTAVLNATTPGETVLRYNVYSRETPGITKTNTPGLRSDTFTINLTSTSSGDMTSGTEVFFAVSTVDTCGEGDLSNEISFTPV